ncbi:hypothetical protein [Kitasatospora indigofera]|uniref:hypothetical protein n=1 Tax=Kitasatospora indigofera TaxID=67307 RepID=UPI00369CE4E5
MATTPQNPQVVARYLTAANATVEVYEGVCSGTENSPVEVSASGHCCGCGAQHVIGETLDSRDDHMWSVAALAEKNVRAWAQRHAGTCRLSA